MLPEGVITENRNQIIDAITGQNTGKFAEPKKKLKIFLANCFRIDFEYLINDGKFGEEKNNVNVINGLWKEEESSAPMRVGEFFLSKIIREKGTQWTLFETHRAIIYYCRLTIAKIVRHRFISITCSTDWHHRQNNKRRKKRINVRCKRILLLFLSPKIYPFFLLQIASLFIDAKMCLSIVQHYRLSVMYISQVNVEVCDVRP